MIIKGSKSSIFITGKSNSKIPFLFVHGFTGSSSTWASIKRKITDDHYCLDIPGHGKSTFHHLDENYGFSDWCAELYMVLSQTNIKKVNLCGYSMGGRLCLEFAYAFPDMINALYLESTSLGIQDLEERKLRLESDNVLVEKIKDDFVSFNRDWSQLDLFAKQEERNNKEFLIQEDIRKHQDKEQLAKSLYSFSLGKMKYYGDKLKDFHFPVTLISGEEDLKFLKIGHRAMRKNKNIKHYIIRDSGHNTHLENPESFIEILKI